MEEGMPSIVSNGAVMTGPTEVADSTSSVNRVRQGGSRFFDSVKFKGVVPQQNGHWGAQIYANHQRIWLGTFKSEMEAAMAYDSAAIRIRSGDSHRNFPWTHATHQEPDFQESHSTEQLLNMIKDGSYQAKFNEFLSVRFGYELGLNARVGTGKGALVFKQLFEKELTPSDVGKLNRLVIPKKFAVKHFPQIHDTNETGGPSSIEDGIPVAGNNEVQLEFHDKEMRVWKFRYCYWKSSQSFVFTRGWSRFVKEKHLKENDTVIFYSCEGDRGEGDGVETISVIDIIRAEDSSNNDRLVETSNGENSNNNGDNNEENNLELSGVGVSECVSHEESGQQMVEENLEEKANDEMVSEAGVSGFRLFGVQIF